MRMMQVKRFACLYTSQVSNLGSFSPEKYYTPSEDLMQHEYSSFESWALQLSVWFYAPLTLHICC